MNSNNVDWKKLIRMVAVIGVLCLFVGIATRVMQKSQTSLNDYARKNPEVALAKPDAEEDSAEKDEATGGDEVTDGEEAVKGGDEVTDGEEAVKSGDEAAAEEDEGADEGISEGINGISEQEIYDNFYYTDEKDGYKFRVMYYNTEHEVCKAELSGHVDDPQEALQYFYDLFKAEHEFKNFAELKSFLDKF